MKQKFAAIAMVVMLCVGMMPATTFAATTVSCDKAMVVDSGTQTLSDTSIEKDVYIEQGCELVTSGEVTITGTVYVFGTFTNTGTLTVTEGLYCLHFGSTFSAGDYDYGYFNTRGNATISNLHVTDSYLSTTIPTVAHDWDDGVVTKEATENETGEKTYTCTVCGETKTESIPKLSGTDTSDDNTTSNKDSDSTIETDGESDSTVETDGESDSTEKLIETSDNTNVGSASQQVSVGRIFTSGGNTYMLKSSTKVAFQEANRKSSSITIPATVTVNGKKCKVTSIAQDAFWGCTNLTSVSIGSNVTSIGSSAFHGCKKLKNITIPDSVTKIGKCAFKGCTNLASVKMGNNLTSIENETFYGCNNLTSIKIGSNVTSIGVASFKNCTKLKSVILPEKLTKIGRSAFEKCTSLKKMTIPANVTVVGKRAFFKCNSLKKVTIKSKKLKSIGAKALKGIKKNATIKVPKSKKKAYKKLINKKAGYTKAMKIK